MTTAKKISKEYQDLIRRYLTWAYKSTKESYDRLERKHTQLMADEFIQKYLSKQKVKNPDPEYSAMLKEFDDYILTKRNQVIPVGKHLYLRHRLEAVKAAITHYLGTKALNQIQQDYEKEFTRRIWEAKDH